MVLSRKLRLSTFAFSAQHVGTRALCRLCLACGHRNKPPCAVEWIFLSVPKVLRALHKTNDSANEQIFDFVVVSSQFRPNQRDSHATCERQKTHSMGYENFRAISNIRTELNPICQLGIMSFACAAHNVPALILEPKIASGCLHVVFCHQNCGVRVRLSQSRYFVCCAGGAMSVVTNVVVVRMASHSEATQIMCEMNLTRGFIFHADTCVDVCVCVCVCASVANT